MITCETIAGLMTSSIGRILPCTPMMQGEFQISTPLLFPDGDYISIFVRQQGARFLVTDAGELAHCLVSNDISLNLTARRREILDEILIVNTTRFEHGEVFAVVEEPEDLPFAIFRVAQSVARGSDMIYSRRFSRGPNKFTEQVATFFEREDIEFTQQYSLDDVFGQSWVFDFLISTGSFKLVQTLSTNQQKYAETLINKAIRQWDAMGRTPVNAKSITMVNDEPGIWRPEALHQLTHHCQVIPFSDRYSYLDVLRAA